jgi:hypothetical protein
MRITRGRIRRGEAAVRAFVKSRSLTGDPVVAIAVLARRPHPQEWVASWVTASGGYCYGKIAVAGSAAGSEMSSGCVRPEGGLLTTREPGLMMFGRFTTGARGDTPEERTVQNFHGFVRGAAKVEAVWDGEPVPVVVVPLGLADDPGLSAVLLEAPAASGARLHGYGITVYDAAGAEVGRAGEDALAV